MGRVGSSVIGRRVASAGAALGGVLVFGLAPVASTPSAHADLFDFDWAGDILGSAAGDSIGDALGGADGFDALLSQIDLGSWFDSLGSFDPLGELSGATGAAPTDLPGLDQWLSQPLQTLLDSWSASPLGSQVDSFLASVTGNEGFNDPAATLFGGDGAAGATAESPAPEDTTTDTLGSTTGSCADVGPGCVPLQITNVTEPVATISVGGGQDIPVVVDTGSNGLVMPWWDLGLQGLSLPTSAGFGAYSGGMAYFYVQMPETIDFGDGLVTSQVPVDVVLFSFPTSLSTLTTAWSLPTFLGSATGADGVLGIAPDAVGPNTGDSVVSALPDEYNDGVLFNEPDKYLQFLSEPPDGGVSVNGVANADLNVSIDGGTQVPVSGAIIDSGGVYGTMPSSVASSLAPGTEISVYNQDGDLLYSYTTGDPLGTPTVISGGTMNTGYYPFIQMPVYIGLGSDGPTTTFYPGQ